MNETVPPEAVTAAARVLSSDPGDIDARTWATAILAAAAPHIAAQAIATHEHFWVRCDQCQSSEPCPCSGGICCPAQEREIAEHAEGYAEGIAGRDAFAAQAAAAEREAIQAHLLSVAAAYDGEPADAVLRALLDAITELGDVS